MSKRKPTRKELEVELYELRLGLGRVNNFLNGIAEILNKFIEFSGKSKKFYASLQKDIDANKKETIDEGKE
tara:strand:- start:780 stop:992 length:213 start_codon:yes stop_codon:yes gene_type:complete